MARIIVVCRGNCDRSPIVQALTRRACAQMSIDVAVESGGLSRKNAGYPASDFSIACMKKRGIDISNHRSRWIGKINLDDFDFIFCAESWVEDQICRMVKYPERVVLLVPPNGILNPHGLSQAAFENCTRMIEKEAIPQIIQILAEKNAVVGAEAN